MSPKPSLHGPVHEQDSKSSLPMHAAECMIRILLGECRTLWGERERVYVNLELLEVVVQRARACRIDRIKEGGGVLLTLAPINIHIDSSLVLEKWLFRCNNIYCELLTPLCRCRRKTHSGPAEAKTPQLCLSQIPSVVLWKIP